MTFIKKSPDSKVDSSIFSYDKSTNLVVIYPIKAEHVGIYKIYIDIKESLTTDLYNCSYNLTVNIT